MSILQPWFNFSVQSLGNLWLNEPGIEHFVVCVRKEGKATTSHMGKKKREEDMLI